MGIDVNKLVFIDESGFQLGMVPGYGRSPQGESCPAYTSRHQGQNPNLLAALSIHGIQASMTLEGNVDTDVFELFVEQCLLPTPVPGQIVICDNYKIHTSLGTKTLIQTRGCQLKFLPTYSPDLNPIEQAFAKIKALVRSLKVTSIEILDNTIALAFSSISLQDILGWFRHAGYPTYRYH